MIRFIARNGIYYGRRRSINKMRITEIMRNAPWQISFSLLTENFLHRCLRLLLKAHVCPYLEFEFPFSMFKNSIHGCVDVSDASSNWINSLQSCRQCLDSALDGKSCSKPRCNSFRACFVLRWKWFENYNKRICPTILQFSILRHLVIGIIAAHRLIWFRMNFHLYGPIQLWNLDFVFNYLQ